MSKSKYEDIYEVDWLVRWLLSLKEVNRSGNSLLSLSRMIRHSTQWPKIGGQATKGIRWMPWRQEAMKDVVSCDKLRGVANKRRSGDFRMGKPTQGYACVTFC